MQATNSPFRDIISMAEMISSSGCSGKRFSKADAEEAVARSIGGTERDFITRYGHNHWNYLKAVLNRYLDARQLSDEFVVKGYPFVWQDTVASKCSAVMLRKNYHKGEHLIEPEMFLEVGILQGHGGETFNGVTYGFHYLDGVDGNDSRFIKGVWEDKELSTVIGHLANDGFRSPLKRGQASANDLLGQ